MKARDSKRTTIPIFQVDAFTDEPFKGNPAAVCLLEREYDDLLLQSIAAEMNLSETAFVLSQAEEPRRNSPRFALRWFTPKIEVPLCGHATLASAKVLFSETKIQAPEITFDTRSGKLVAKREKDGICLDFPANPPVPHTSDPDYLTALGLMECEDMQLAKSAKKLLIRVGHEDIVQKLEPDFQQMLAVESAEAVMGIIVTSKSASYDFVSRFFAPWIGINEDPVTGAAHTVLAPYWSSILGKVEMSAYQASSRGGELSVRITPNGRVNMIGKAVVVSKGELYV